MNRIPRSPLNRLKRLAALSLLSCGALSALLLGGCAAPTGTQTPGALAAPPSVSTEPGPDSAAVAPAPRQTAPAVQTSLAPSAKAYRQDAARHVYAQHNARIFKGRMPPMLYAIGVLNVDIDRQGQIQALKWTRAPQHAPEVMADIERMVRAAAPFPAPARLEKVTYTDVWLWDKSGRFQLDTLTEGQD